MHEIKEIGKKKLSCQKAFNNLKVKDVDSFYRDAMLAFGVGYKENINRKVRSANLSPIEIKAFEEIFEKYGITGNIWTDAD